MPQETIALGDRTYLMCGCEIEGALIEACCVKLGIVGPHMEYGVGDKTVGRAARHQITRVLELFELSPLDALLDLIPRSDFS
jgi:hypothetical protein